MSSDKKPKIYNNSVIVHNFFIRCALFTANKKTTNYKFQNKIIYSEKIKGKQVVIKRTGKELTQFDFDIFSVLVTCSIKGEDVKNHRAILKLAGKGESSHDYKKLRASLEKLTKTLIKYSYEDSLQTKFKLLKVKYFKGEKYYCLDDDFYKVMELGKNTYININIRKKLNSDLAKWLCNLYKSHNKDKKFMHSLINLQQKTGMTCSPASFRTRLQNALSLLNKIGFICDAKIEKYTNGEWYVGWNGWRGCCEFNKSCVDEDGLYKESMGQSSNKDMDNNYSEDIPDDFDNEADVHR